MSVIIVAIRSRCRIHSYYKLQNALCRKWEISMQPRCFRMYRNDFDLTPITDSDHVSALRKGLQIADKQIRFNFANGH